ncbi:MAG: leucine-rich repeat domain-containing protein [Prevotella sp.]|nr:leucine-rich repeat domain-containing protein [Prevotella sp.]
MKKLFLSTLLLALPLLASAYDIAVKNADDVTIYYNYVNNATELEVTSGSSSYNLYSGAVNIPEEVTYMSRTRKVTSIGNSAFNQCTGLTSVTIPNSVTSIGNHAFYYCNSLTSVHITDVAAWCKITFYDSSSNPLGYARHLYMNGEEIKDLVIPNSVTSIRDHAFRNCIGLTSVTIPNSVTSIGSYAFYNCSGLTSVHITDLAAWCKIAFDYESNPLEYAHHLFLNGKEIKDLVIPNFVTTIGSSAFRACTNLTSVTIPNSVTSIGGAAFAGCTNLTSVHITDLAAWCKIAFNSSNPLSYAHHLFLNGEEIKDLVIPSSVTTIGGSAFSNCSGLISVTIPNSVTSIESYAFGGCTGLTSVISKMENPCFIDYYCFDRDVFYNTTLYVPKGTTDKYKSTDCWSRFMFIEEGEPGGSTQPEEKKCATPSISYANKKLTFSCATEGVTYSYSITDTDIKSAVASSIDLSATYEISVFASKSGYINSDMATATLVWTNAEFTETTPSTSSAKAIAESIPMLISAKDGNITVRGEQNGLPLTVYTAEGKMLGSATIKDGQASISTNMQRGEIAIVKVGKRSVKVKM